METTSNPHRLTRLLLISLQICLLDGELTSLSPEDDVLTPYTEGHGPTHSHRYVKNCQSVIHGRRTYETWPSNQHHGLPVAESSVFISDVPGGEPRLVQGHMALVRDPLRTVSVLEPGGPGGCMKDHRVTVHDTAETAGCMYALNAGFFNTTTDGCLGNVVSDGTLGRDSRGRQNAQFGIRKNGSLVFGYLSQDDVLDRENPFVQLVSGVVWLLRNGEIYINQSLRAECDRLVDQEVFRDFVDVLSARTVVGHDKEGNLVLFQVDGQTLKRGMNLWEVAEFLKKNGVINAINLDGGGSSSFVINGTLASYPPDICTHDSRWRCPRAVSTVLCVHRPRCQPANCSGHGECVDGRCRCHKGWKGDACDSLVCQPAECGSHGVCSPGGCVCHAGWSGKNCNLECLSGYFGAGCTQTCACLNGASCHRVTGHCRCPPGYHGRFCEEACPPGFYGLFCAHRCQCENECPCDPLTGSCPFRLNKADQCYTGKTWVQLDKAFMDRYNLPELTWLTVVIVVAALLIRLALYLRRTRCKRILSIEGDKQTSAACSSFPETVSECLLPVC